MQLKKVIVALDSFKGSLSSVEAGKSLIDGIKEVDDSIKSVLYSVADGGEGTIDALQYNCGGTIHTVEVNDPLFRPITAVYSILEDDTAVIEMATASGLPLVEPELRNPLNTTTYGTGELIKHALDKGCTKFILAIGGSATNDAGIGMLSALGVKFLDSAGKEVSPVGGSVGDVYSIDDTNMHPKLKSSEFTVACDVDNPLYGKNGAAYIYGAQKGATPQIIEQLDGYLQHFADIIQKQYNKDIANFKGSGAAGGMGAGLMAFTNTVLKSGIDIILDQIGIDAHLKDADIVFVGEGQLDKQTAMGKAPMGIAQRAKKHGIPVIAIGGSVDRDPVELHDAGITAYFSAVGRPMSLEQAMSPEETRAGLKRQGRELVQLIKL